MLNLQQILESDTLSTVVSKINANFRALGVAGGGPPGRLGQQGVPGRPGLQGPVGPTGPIGPTGNVTNVIPFVSYGSYTGPSTVAGPWPVNSLAYLNQYASTGTSNVWIDHKNNGYWKYLTTADATGQYSGISSPYPPSGTGYFAGEGWYFYPTDISLDVPDNPWTSDTTSYLSLPPFGTGPFLDEATSPLQVKNARMSSKFGTVWISSGNDYTDSASFESYDTDEIGKSWTGGYAFSNVGPFPGRWNAGLDRLLFKMSLDGLPYLANINARIETAAGQDLQDNSGSWPNKTTTPGAALIQGESYWTKPVYPVTQDEYTPLIFLSERKTSATDPFKFGSLAISMFTADNTAESSYGGQHRFLVNMSTRYALSPEDYVSANNNLGATGTDNFGEGVFDFRRLITTNQFVVNTPYDTKFSSDAVTSGNYVESVGSKPSRVYQGYVAGINQKYITGTGSNLSDYLNYGDLGETGAFEVLGTAGYQTRQTWYGSGFLDLNPSEWTSSATTNDENNYYRVAGMMERGKKTFAANNQTAYLSELLFYTSNVSQSTSHTAGVGRNLLPDLSSANPVNSKAVFYASPYQSMGVGTFPVTAGAGGVFEPIARLQLHHIWSEGTTSTDPLLTYRNISQTQYLPGNLFTTLAVTSQPSTGSVGANNYTDILIGGYSGPAYESSNPLQSGLAVTTGSRWPSTVIRSHGWSGSFKSSLRLGANPSATGQVGRTNDNLKTEFQFSIHPLGTANYTASSLTGNIAGLGLHNLYPSSRVHFYGKNNYNEVEFGKQPWTPGAVSATSTSFPYYTGNSASDNQVVIDYIGNGYVYPTAIYEYPYEAFGMAGLTSSATGNVGSFSPNAINFPTRDSLSPTRNRYPYSPSDVNLGYPSAVGLVNNSRRHGGTANAWLNPNKYLGFNLFRDLTNTGDDKDNTRWMVGTDGNGDNGGAAIMANSWGDLAITSIPRRRDGGYPYSVWEQRGLGTRDVVNNIKFVFTADGALGIGGKPGVDPDAYPALGLSGANGRLYYLPFTDARSNAPITALTSGVTSGTPRYGEISYSGVSATYVESGTTSSAAQINSKATLSETIRLEVAAEKAYYRVGRNLEARGYGYPTSSALTIANPFRYVISSSSFTVTSFIIYTDGDGRISSILFKTPTPTDPTGSVIDVVLPHPSEFENGAAQSLGTGFIAPAGAAAGEIDTFSFAEPDIPDGSFYGTFTFVRSAPQSANVRLNNFVAGEGYVGVSGQTGTDYTYAQTKAVRQTSPKLIFTFLEQNPNSRSISGSEPIKKVSTVLASAQNESSLREFWIPKADNSGGTLMVFTDHMGEKEKDSGFDNSSVSTSKLKVDQVVTQEWTYTFITGNLPVGAQVTGGYQAVASLAPAQSTNVLQPMYVKYSNRAAEYVGAGSYTGFNAGVYGIATYTPGRLGGAAYGAPGTSSPFTNGSSTGTAILHRNVDYFYSVASGASGRFGLQDANSEIRFKRINSEYVLMDYNITVGVSNEPAFTGPGASAGATGYIDYGSPRYTQAVRFAYYPDENDTLDYTKLLYGGGPNFNNWSFSRNWYSGAAVVGPLNDGYLLGATGFNDPYFSKLNPADDGSPFMWDFNNTSSVADRGLHWNGNMLQAFGQWKNVGSDFYDLDATVVIRQNGDNTSSLGDTGLGNPIDGAASAVAGVQYNSMYDGTATAWPNIDFGSYTDFKRKVINVFKNHQYALWGNRAFARNANTQWRLVPAYIPSNTGTAVNTHTSNSFYLEVMLDNPILHSDHIFKGNYFNPGASDVRAYQYLTLSGQAILRYGEGSTVYRSDLL